MVFHCTGTLSYLAACITLQLIRQCSARRYSNMPLSRGPRNLALSTVVNITFLPTIFNEGGGHVFLWLTDTRHL